MKKNNSIVFWLLITLIVLQMTAPTLLFWLLIVCIMFVLIGGLKK